MWIEPWKREEWVISRSGARWLPCAFWGQIPLILLSPFLAYWSYLSLLGRPTPLAGHPMQVLCGLIGGVGVFCAFMLEDAMQVFDRGRDYPAKLHKKFWRTIVKFRIFPGPALYFWFIYRSQMKESGFITR